MECKSFSTQESDYTWEDLNSQTVASLRQLARNDQIKLSGAKKKSDIVNVMLVHYLAVKSSDSEITLPKTFAIVTDDASNINVSVWFKGNSRALERCLGLKRFKRLLDEYCKRNQKQPSEVLIYEGIDNDVYLPPVLAIFVASYLSPQLHYDILQYYLYCRLDDIESVHRAETDYLKQQLAVAELGLKLDRGLSWVSFEAPFAYYWFLIDTTVKAGSVGTNSDLKDSNKESLNMRLASHRSTHAKLVLLGVLKFRNSSSITTFES